MNRFYLTLFFFIFSHAAFTQTINLFGNGTSGNVVVGGSNYNITESVYTDIELNSQFVTAATAIEKVSFFISSQTPPAFIVSNFTMYMQNVPSDVDTLFAENYSLSGYTQVYTGSVSVNAADFTADITLDLPFARTPGSNLKVLVVRNDGIVHPTTVFLTRNGNSGGTSINSSRRYNGTSAPVLGVTSLTPSAFRPAMRFRHVFAVNASAFNIFAPEITSCHNSPKTLGVLVVNEGSSTIPAGALTTSLEVSIANSQTGSQINTVPIAPDDSLLVLFPGFNLNNPGFNTYKAWVTLAGDQSNLEDSVFLVLSQTLPILGNDLSDYPVIDSFEVQTTIPLFNFRRFVNTGRRMWRNHIGNYTNTDQVQPLVPRTPGNAFVLFDSYSGPSSLDFIQALYGPCLKIPQAPLTTLSFWMSSDNLFPADQDSLYISVSNDRGATWTRLSPGFARYDATSLTPTWRQRIVDITAYAGQVIQIGFEGVSKFGNIIAVDDIEINYFGPVPITLLQFDARRAGAENLLTWRTATEINSGRFVVERSPNGTNFEDIGSVIASGNSQSPRDYNFSDARPLKGYNYYRLRQVDLDSRIAYSQVKLVRNVDLQDVVLAPNPVKDVLQVRLTIDKASRTSLRILDAGGKSVSNVLLAVQRGFNQFDVQVGHLSPGVYYVHLESGGERVVRQIVKQ